MAHMQHSLFTTGGGQFGLHIYRLISFLILLTFIIPLPPAAGVNAATGANRNTPRTHAKPDRHRHLNPTHAQRHTRRDGGTAQRYPHDHRNPAHRRAIPRAARGDAGAAAHQPAQPHTHPAAG